MRSIQVLSFLVLFVSHGIWSGSLHGLIPTGEKVFIKTIKIRPTTKIKTIKVPVYEGYSDKDAQEYVKLDDIATQIDTNVNTLEADWKTEYFGRPFSLKFLREIAGQFSVIPIFWDKTTSSPTIYEKQ